MIQISTAMGPMSGSFPSMEECLILLLNGVKLAGPIIANPFTFVFCN